MSSNVNPLVDWLELPESVDFPNHYQLLGIDEFEDDEQAIKGAYYRRVARVRIHQRGVNAETCKDVFAQLAKAKDCLVDPNARAKYNRVLKQNPTSASPQSKPRHRSQSAFGSARSAAEQQLSGFSKASLELKSNRRSETEILRSKLPYQSNRARSPFDMLTVMRTPEEILEEIVETRGLTPYQVKLFIAKNPEDLVLGPYLLENELRKGTWGQVYTASRISTGEMVVVRVLPSTFKTVRTSLKKYILRAKKIPSQRFQRAFDYAEKQQRYLASEYIPGEDLKNLVERKGMLTIAQAVYCAARIVENMAAAQKANQLHLELRPSKILVNRVGQVFIRDIAIANVVSQHKRQFSNPGKLTQVLPTEHLQFLAPEVFFGDALPSFQSDIYSIGCILFYLLTGRYVFPNDDALRIVVAHRESAIPSLVELDPSFPDALDHCVRRMLSKTPGNRFSSYEQLHQNLKQIYRQLGGGSVSSKSLWKDVEECTQPSSVALTKVRRFHLGRIATAAAIMIGVISAGAGGVSLLNREIDESPASTLSGPASETPLGPKILQSDDNYVPEVQAVDSFELR